ncbi:MAG: uroporphyrinogen-III C-methyltransferase [Gammaproteobacteria bacterium]|nr:uroporphyrinogen-III C-methyltransferase [Gammaproteobacteria bacterium]
MSQNQSVLRGQCILNTRPLHQQNELNALLESGGASVLAFPAIEIVECEVTEFHRNLSKNIGHYDIAIFVSRNAVDGAFGFLIEGQLPVNLQLGVIGQGTYRALADRVDDLDQRLILGHPYNSEGLLACPELHQVEGRKILILRGQQGRNLLGDELRARGATVSYCEVYRRRKPDYAANAFDLLTATQFPTLAVFTSNEGMHNAMAAISGSARREILDIPWLLISERMRESALDLGHNAVIIIAANADDEGIQQTINEWASDRPSEVMRKKKPSSKKEITEDPVVSKEVVADSNESGNENDVQFKANVENKAEAEEKEKQLTSEKPAEKEEVKKAVKFEVKKPVAKPDPAPKPKKPARASAGFPVLGLLNLLLIIGIIAAAAYYWQQQQKLELKKQATLSAMQQQLATRASKADTEQLQQRLQPLESRLGTSASKIGELEQQQQALLESTEKLYELYGRDENGWQLAEVEYLMRIAQHKLTLENDFEGAAITLQAASDKIAATADPGLLPVRVQISDEIATLKTRSRPDLVGMTLLLAQLTRQIRALKPGYEPRIDTSTGSLEPQAIDPSTLSVEERVMSFLSSLVTIKRDESLPTQTEALVIDIEEVLENNLKLTRWTVLERDAFQYSRLMDDNVKLFKQYYDLDNAANYDFYSQLLQLQKSKIKPEKPDINGSLEMLKFIINKRQQAPTEQLTQEEDNA